MTALQVKLAVTDEDTIQPIVPGYGRGCVAVNKDVELIVTDADQAARLAGAFSDLAEYLLSRDGVPHG